MNNDDSAVDGISGGDGDGGDNDAEAHSASAVQGLSGGTPSSRPREAHLASTVQSTPKEQKTKPRKKGEHTPGNSKAALNNEVMRRYLEQYCGPKKRAKEVRRTVL